MKENYMKTCKILLLNIYLSTTQDEGKLYENLQNPSRKY